MLFLFSIPTMSDVISYEEGTNSDIKSGYPRFVLHPYLKKMAEYLHKKYFLNETDEIVLVSSTKFANFIREKYNIKENIEFKEEFGVVLVSKKQMNCKVFYVLYNM